MKKLLGKVVLNTFAVETTTEFKNEEKKERERQQHGWQLVGGKLNKMEEEAETKSTDAKNHPNLWS